MIGKLSFFIRYGFKSVEPVFSSDKNLYDIFFFNPPAIYSAGFILDFIGKNVNFWVSILFYWNSFYIAHDTSIYNIQ